LDHGNGNPAGRLIRSPDEIQRAAYGADVAAIGDFAVDLPGQIDFDGGIDRGEAGLLREG
jgi:hypothetical protein